MQLLWLQEQNLGHEKDSKKFLDFLAISCNPFENSEKSKYDSLQALLGLQGTADQH